LEGWAKKSYWIEVAKIAWLSEEIILESKNMLQKLEKTHKNISNNQLSLWEVYIEPEIKIIEKKSEIEEKIKSIDINNLSPIEALNFLNELKK
jgi:DNA mismatch repair protein MutS